MQSYTRLQTRSSGYDIISPQRFKQLIHMVPLKRSRLCPMNLRGRKVNEFLLYNYKNLSDDL